MNNKNYFIFAAAIALASCSVDEYMGENPEFTQTTKENIIGFGGGTGSMSRATSNTGTTEQMLDYQFKVYGWKTESDGTTTQKVFNNYWVWYEGTNKTPSNPDATEGAEKGWEYVGVKDKQMPFNDPSTSATATLKNTQYIKYWDYSATDYKFVAGSPIDKIEFHPKSGESNDKYAIETATVSGLGGHINPNTSGDKIDPAPVYIAQPTVIKKDKYKEAVNLQFTRLQTKVRVGIYETIKGYSISAIKFYKQGDSGLEQQSANENNVVLTSSENVFFGAEDATATVTYDWDNANSNAKPSFNYKYQNLEGQKNWYGGKFVGGIKATSSNESDVEKLYGTDKDMESSTGYFTVIPNNNDKAIIIKCDYTLTSDDGSNETINVKGATAAIPAAYCKWEPNKMYTYIFKISQETNGTTGNPDDNDKPGLFPITFDATVIAETEAQQGTETIINAPSITTYQDGSVTANGIEYVINEKIDVTVTDNSTGKDNVLNQQGNTNGCLKVYFCGNSSLVTEADLQASGIKSTYAEITGEGKISVSGTQATFTPENAGYYAIQYCSDDQKDPIVYKYKVIYVKAATTSGS